MVLMGELASLEMAAMMGRSSAAEEGGSFLDLLHFCLFSDGDLDLALLRQGDEDLVLGVWVGEEGGVGNPVGSTSISSSTISSSTASVENLFRQAIEGQDVRTWAGSDGNDHDPPVLGGCQGGVAAH